MGHNQTPLPFFLFGFFSGAQSLLWGRMQYRCETTSITGFVQQIACTYLRHGYWFYVTGIIPEGKDPRAVDAKLIKKYDIAVSESTRGRRKRQGKANLQYLRHQRLFVILATDGDHPFKDEERENIRDMRRVPLKFAGYSISYRRGGRTMAGEVDSKWHAHVEIERERYKEIRDYLLELSTHRTAKYLALSFYEIPFEPYAPVRRQLLNILRVVNRARKRAGYELLPTEVLPLRRRVVRPFGDNSPDRRELIESISQQPGRESGPSRSAEPASHRSMLSADSVGEHAQTALRRRSSM